MFLLLLLLGCCLFGGGVCFVVVGFVCLFCFCGFWLVGWLLLFLLAFLVVFVFCSLTIEC